MMDATFIANFLPTDKILKVTVICIFCSTVIYTACLGGSIVRTPALLGNLVTVSNP